ncbi:hypothetical protein AB0N87_26165 [Streptomyces sp. NPDC093228]|uniref:hypothetical protein n=1 Tax=Streptomyces sp. NPDC093228 TaxID=3155070 RepID=UPI00343EC054
MSPFPASPKPSSSLPVRSQRSARHRRGPARPRSERDASPLTEQVEQTLYAPKVISYTQGLHQIQAVSDTYGWNVDLAAVAAVWRAGCIIRAVFLDRVRTATPPTPPCPVCWPALASPGKSALPNCPGAWRFSRATRDGVHAPAFAAALAHYDTTRTPLLPSALTQAQLDYFGAHTYRPGSYHTRWDTDRTEEPTL